MIHRQLRIPNLYEVPLSICVAFQMRSEDLQLVREDVLRLSGEHPSLTDGVSLPLGIGN